LFGGKGLKYDGFKQLNFKNGTTKQHSYFRANVIIEEMGKGGWARLIFPYLLILLGLAI
jgi:hypothetical protein